MSTRSREKLGSRVISNERARRLLGFVLSPSYLELRKKLGGRFKRVTDLLRVKGIGQKSLKKMEPHLVLDAPKAVP